jgi:hypothetical protein
MNHILAALDRRRPIFIALVESFPVLGQNIQVIEQTYALSLAGISAAVDGLQSRHAKTRSAESLAVVIRTKPSRSCVAADGAQVA